MRSVRIKAACDAAPTSAIRDGIGSSFLEIIDFWLHWNRINCVPVFENCLGRNEVVPVHFSHILFFLFFNYWEILVRARNGKYDGLSNKLPSMGGQPLQCGILRRQPMAAIMALILSWDRALAFAAAARAVGRLVAIFITHSATCAPVVLSISRTQSSILRSYHMRPLRVSVGWRSNTDGTLEAMPMMGECCSMLMMVAACP